MKNVISTILGLGALALLFSANSAPFATLPVAGTLRLAETPFAGNHRLYLAAILLLVASQWRVWPAALAGVAVGLLTDMAISAWLWRAEKLELLADLGSADAVRLIQWRAGAVYFAAGCGFALALFLWELYGETRKTRTL